MKFSRYLTIAYLIYFSILWNAPAFGFLKYNERVFNSLRFEKSLQVRALEDGIIKGGQQEVDVQILNSKYNLRVTLNELRIVEYGEILELNPTCRRPKVTESFDEEKYLQKEGILARCEGIISGTLRRRQLDIPMDQVWALKRSLRRTVNEFLPEPHASFLTALMIGGGDYIPTSISNDFRKAGTSHILAISGYNISMIITLVTGLLGSLAIRKSRLILYSLFFILFFVSIVGFEPSVVRAALMGSFALLARLVERKTNMRNILLLSAVIMTIINPLLLRYDIGFQLSFAATLGMFYGTGLIEGPLNKILPSFLQGTLIPTLAASIFTIPIQAYYFGTLSLAAIPANLILLPIVPYTMLIVAVLMVCGAISSFLGGIISPVAWGVSSSFLRLNHFFASLSWAQKSITLSVTSVFLIYFILFSLVIIKSYYAQRQRVIANT